MRTRKAVNSRCTQPAAAQTPPNEDRRSGRDPIQERISRAKRTAVNARLSDLGFGNADSLKSALQTARTAQSSIETERGKVTTLEGEKATLQQQLTGKVVREALPEEQPEPEPVPQPDSRRRGGEL